MGLYELRNQVEFWTLGEDIDSVLTKYWSWGLWGNVNIPFPGFASHQALQSTLKSSIQRMIGL